MAQKSSRNMNCNRFASQRITQLHDTKKDDTCIGDNDSPSQLVWVIRAVISISWFWLFLIFVGD